MRAKPCDGPVLPSCRVGKPRKSNRNSAANRFAGREVALAADEDRRLLPLRLPRSQVCALQIDGRRRMRRGDAGVDEAAGRGVKGEDAGKAEVFVELGKVQSFCLRCHDSSVCGISNRLLRRRLRRRLHQIDEELIEPRQIEIGLDMNKLKIERGLIRCGPRKRISIERPAIEVYVDVKFLLFGDDRRIEPGCGSQLVPQVVKLALCMWRDTSQQGSASGRSRRASALVKPVLMEMSTVVRSMRGQCARRVMCAASGSNQKLNSCRGLLANSGSLGLRIEAAAHDDNALRKLREVRIDRDRQRNIGQRTGGVDRHLMRMRVNLANQKVSGILR